MGSGMREPFGPRFESLSTPGILDPALSQVGHVGAGDDATRGPLELDAATPAAVLATVGFQEKLEPAGDVRQ
jgi:hypothetical protein